MKRHVITFLSLALLATQPGLAGQRSASMGVSLVVQRSATFKVADTFQQLDVSSADFSKGYLDIPGTLQFVVNTGAQTRRVLNVTVEVEPNPELFRSIQMLARSKPLADAAADAKSQDDASSIALGYRVQLTDKAKAGDFNVPVTLTVNL
jgi:hypothetical protein